MRYLFLIFLSAYEQSNSTINSTLVREKQDESKKKKKINIKINLLIPYFFANYVKALVLKYIRNKIEKKRMKLLEITLSVICWRYIIIFRRHKKSLYLTPLLRLENTILQCLIIKMIKKCWYYWYMI